jgi:hypothetical protein
LEKEKSQDMTKKEKEEKKRRKQKETENMDAEKLSVSYPSRRSAHSVSKLVPSEQPDECAKEG